MCVCMLGSMLHHGDLDQKHSGFEIKYSMYFAPKLDNCQVFFFFNFMTIFLITQPYLIHRAHFQREVFLTVLSGMFMFC